MEDHPLVAEATNGLLEANGFQVRVATSASTMHKYLRQSDDVDLVVLDMKLPDADAYKVVPDLVARNIPVLVYSALGDMKTIDFFDGIGAHGFVVKFGSGFECYRS